MQETEPGAGRELNLLLVIWEGLDTADLEPGQESGLEPGDVEFWPADLAQRGSRGALAGHKAGQAEAFWRGCLSLGQEGRVGRTLFHSLSRRGLPPGLVNLPWPVEPEGHEVFFIGRAPAGAAGPLIHPPELARDLADYVPDPPAPLRAGPSKLSRGLTDLAFAEQAAVCRIRFEHALRLCRQYCPGMLALSLGGHDLMKILGPRTSRRRRSLRAQLSRYCAWLDERLRPGAVALLSDGNPGRPGLLVVRAPGLAPGGDLGPLSWAGAARVLADAAPAGRGQGPEAP